jgi:hypothetical protein
MKLLRFHEHIVEGIEINVEKKSVQDSTNIAELWKELHGEVKQVLEDSFSRSVYEVISEYHYEILDYEAKQGNMFEYLLDSGGDELFLVDINFNWEHPIQISVILRGVYDSHQDKNLFHIKEGTICREKSLKSAFEKLQSFKKSKLVYLQTSDRYSTYQKNLNLVVKERPTTIEGWEKLILEELPKQGFVVGRTNVEFFCNNLKYVFTHEGIRRTS